MSSWEDVLDIIIEKEDRTLDKAIEKIAIGYSMFAIEDFFWNVAILKKFDNSVLAIVKHVKDNALFYSIELLEFIACEDVDLITDYQIAGYVNVDGLKFAIIFED